MRDVPAEVRATWPDFDYDSPVQRGSTLIVVETCLVSLALLTLLARIYARLVVVKGVRSRCPIRAYWLVGHPQHCSPEGPPALQGPGNCHVITDFVVVVLSPPIVMKLHLPRHQRVMLALLFSGGLIVVLVGCQRAYWSYYVIEKTYDVTWEEFYLWIRTTVEANLGVICGNVPALRPLYGVVVTRCSGRRIGSQSNNQVTWL
ncbi:hypothetical protein B0J13DRAFT_571819, partial [Dactylonectria estremocensis]